MKYFRLAAAILLFAHAAAWADGDPYVRYRDQREPAYEEDEPYSLVHGLEGVGALFIAVGEPIYFRPAKRIQDCTEGSSPAGEAALIPLCALGGALEGLFFSIRDVTVGLGDILTFGVFRLSRNAGVYDPFTPSPPPPPYRDDRYDPPYDR